MGSINYKEQEGTEDKSRKVRGRDRARRHGTRTEGKAGLGQDWHQGHGTGQSSLDTRQFCGSCSCCSWSLWEVSYSIFLLFFLQHKYCHALNLMYYLAYEYCKSPKSFSDMSTAIKHTMQITF